MTQAPTLFLLRHGETEWNHSGRIQGSLDSPLTAKGRQQALAMRTILDRLGEEVASLPVFVSPLERVRVTASLAVPNRPHQIEPRLSEIACGAWEGLTPVERKAGWPDLAARCHSDLDLYDLAPGGEGLAGVQRRVEDFLADLEGPTIIVAHKVVLIVMRGLLQGLTPSDWHRLEAPQGVVIRVADGVEHVLS